MAFATFYLAMLFDAMWYEVREEQESPGDDLWKKAVLWMEEIVVGYAAYLLTMPVAFILVFIFDSVEYFHPR